MEELSALEGDAVACGESRAVINSDCVAMEDVGRSATLRVDTTHDVSDLPDGNGVEDVCVVASDDDVSSCRESVRAAAVDMPASTQVGQNATSRHSCEAIMRLHAWCLDTRNTYTLAIAY